MDDFMEVVAPSEDVKDRERSLRVSKLADTVSNYVKETELHYNELEVRLVEEGWPQAIVHEAVKYQLLLTERYATYMRQMLRTPESDLDKLETEFQTTKVYMSDMEFKEKMREHIDKLKKEDALKEEAHRYEEERRNKLMREEASRVDYSSMIDEYVKENKRTRCVSARELADRLMQKLTPEQRENLYFNQPLYAAYKNIGSPLFEESFTECIQAYQKSIVIQKVINDYLDKVSPSRDRDDYELDKVIEMLPNERKTLDDRNYQAYTAICWLNDIEAQRKALEEFTINDLQDEGLKQEFTAQAWSDVSHGEPYDVAYRNSFEKAIGKMYKQYGKIKAFPTHLADVANQSLSLGQKETLGQNLYDKIQKDKEIERIVQEKNRERDELKAQLEAERNKQPQQTYQYRQYPYGSQYYGNNTMGYYNQTRQNNNIPVKYIGIGVNAAIIIVCLLFEKLVGTSTFMLWVGLGIATYGWVISPTQKDYTQGNYYGTHPNRFVSTTDHRTQGKWIWFVVGGYLLFLISFLIMAAF